MPLATLAVVVSFPVLSLQAQEPASSIAEKTVGMQRRAGFLDTYWDGTGGRLLVTIPAFGEELLFTASLASGLGSNPVGLDRASLGPTYVVEFRRSGPKVLMVAVNHRYRATSEDPRERRAVADSFAVSVLWGFRIAAESEGRVLVDATDFLLRDAVDAAGRLSRSGQGQWSLDASRSAVLQERCKSFPDNTELEVLLTLTGDGGPLVRETAASGDAVSLRQHFSFVRLPDEGYRPRAADPRVGYFGIRFADYGTPLTEPLEKTWISRHRLQKKDPSAAVSDPVRPIVYYLDPGAPEPVRSALMEGASWWTEAFEAAGFRNAFRVELLPDGADPMDVRYNVIHWVHRSTRGWSYGGSVRDPRTGEILKGNVLLGSLRARQDLMLFAGLEGPYQGCAAAHSPGCEHFLQAGQEELALQLTLSRLRQLAAHEVGHTLGLSHNFAASGYGRASVMDYPAPLVKPVEFGRLDFTHAYATGIGDYDKWAIRFGYAQFPEGADEEQGLAAIVREGLAAGYLFLTDQDARAESTGNPLASLWDNGSDPVSQLVQDLRVREIGLSQFGLRNLRPGRSLAELEDVLVPLYLHHRYQLEAALKVLGGVEYRHAVKGDGQPEPRPSRNQRAVLQVALQTLLPGFLELGLDQAIPPAGPQHPSQAERFPRYTGGPPDAMAMAATCADLTIQGLLQRNRAARLCSPQQASAGEPDLLEVVDALVEATWNAAPVQHPRGRMLQRVVQMLVVDRLMDLAADGRAYAESRAIARQVLADLEANLEERARTTSADLEKLHLHDTVRRIHFFLVQPDQGTRRLQVEAPPGSPIGTGR